MLMNFNMCFGSAGRGGARFGSDRWLSLIKTVSGNQYKLGTSSTKGLRKAAAEYHCNLGFILVGGRFELSKHYCAWAKV